MIEWKIGDCLELMDELDDGSVDLVIADPPYYRVADVNWDKQWKTFDDYLDWIEEVSINIKRILKPNGSFYIFGDDHRIAYVQVRLDKHFTFLNHLVWYKRNNQAIQGAENSRRYACVSERILFYTLQDETGLATIHSLPDCFKPIKEYMKGEYQKVVDANGFKTKAECDAYLNKITDTKSVVTRHYFADSQYCFPTFELYGKLRKTGFFKRNYEDLRQEYEDLRQDHEGLRRTFNPHKGQYEIFNIPCINQNENTNHPTTKPKILIEKLIQSSSNEGDLILDPFLGSGTTLEACRRTNRNCIGFEIDPQWDYLYSKRSMNDIPSLESYEV